MKKTLLLLLSMVGTLLPAQTLNKDYLAYIEKYSEIAITEQHKYGIPASITIAQGLLESGAGKGELAVQSNNHFGIKCHNEWNGQKFYYDDDEKNECFRKYNKVAESYEDHSKFLQRPRYESLFQLKPTDYKGWANGLKKAGYATDPNYATKLIKLIEDYNLQKLDVQKATVADKTKPTTKEETVVVATETTSTSVVRTKQKSSMGTVDAFTQYVVKKRNGIKYVEANGGETYADIASTFEMKTDALLKYNDVSKNEALAEGARVYLGMKKNKAGKANTSHRVRKNETLYSISQLYGIKLSKLCEMNEMPENTELFEGLKLRLR